jgi:hypothetical protein
MEKLQRRSDGYFETPSGLFAVQPKAVSGSKDGLSFFEFKVGVLSDRTRVEWPSDAPIIVIDQQVAVNMMRARYAYNITEAQMDDYNTAVDNYLQANGFDPANVPTPQTPEPPAEPVSEPVVEPEQPPAVPESDVPPAPPVPDAPPAPEGGKKGKKTAE